MLLGHLQSIGYSIADTAIFQGVTAEIPLGSCIALVGANGTGKTTLLEIMAGVRKQTEGSLHWIGKRPSITYFKQVDEDAALRGTAETGLHRSRWNVAGRDDYKGASGGERMKLRLSDALSEQSELYMLDEPTNHLDEGGLKELIRVIKEKEATFIIVSHDRHFIDQVADHVFALEDGKLTVYTGNYTDYRAKRAHARDVQRHQYDKQQRKIAMVEDQIAQLSEWSAKAHRESTKKGGAKEYFRMKAKKKDVQIRSKRKRLEAELAKNRIEKPAEDITVSFDVEGAKKRGNRILELQKTGKSYGGRILFKDVSLTVQAGERLALSGPNGCGKSTLFKMLLGEESGEGDIWLSPGLSIGYMSQTTDDLPGDKAVAAFFNPMTFADQGHVRTLLAGLGLDSRHWNLPIGQLSQGERVKIKLMQFILEGKDLLLLDEPTNHLDLPSREQLESTLATFPGTLLIASHDRFFVSKLSKGLLLFDKGTVRKVLGTLDDQEELPAINMRPAQDRLVLETRLQAILGELSTITPADPKYAELDHAFRNVSRELREL